MINSPRSLRACEQLGVDPLELYQLTTEKFKEKYPELINANEKLFQIRYEAEEKFREETIKQVKEGRKKIIAEESKKKEETSKEMKKSNSKLNNNNNEEVDKKWEKILEKEKRAIEKVQKKQRQNIESLIEGQINKELMIKVNEAKEIINKKKEEENEKNLIEKRKLEEKERQEKEKKKEENLRKQQNKYH